MTRRNLKGAGICAVLLVVAFASGDGARHYLNGVGLAIVLLGTAGAALLSFPLDMLRATGRVVSNVYRQTLVTPGAIVDALVDVAILSRDDGLLSLEALEDDTEVTFLKSGLEMLVDGYDEPEIRESLVSEMLFFRRRRQQHERVFRHLAQVAPAFGVAGSVVGLIGMLAGLGNTAVMLEAIPLALTSTLYGVLLGSFVLNPIAESIRSKTEQELLLQRLIVEGVAAVQRESRPARLERRLLSFLTPAERQVRARSFGELRSRVGPMRSAAGPEAPGWVQAAPPPDPAAS